MATLFNRNIINSKPLPLSEVRHCMLFKIKLNSHAEEKMLLLRRSWRRQKRVHYCRLNSTMMRGRGSGGCVNIRWEMCRNLLFYAILMRVNLAFVNGALDCYTTLPHHHHLGRVTFTASSPLFYSPAPADDWDRMLLSMVGPWHGNNREPSCTPKTIKALNLINYMRCGAY